MTVGLALVASTAGIKITPEAKGFSVAQTQGMNKRQDRRQDCSQEEGAVGKDKRDCKQDERQDRNNDNSPTSIDD